MSARDSAPTPSHIYANLCILSEVICWKARKCPMWHSGSAAGELCYSIPCGRYTTERHPTLSLETRGEERRIFMLSLSFLSGIRAGKCLKYGPISLDDHMVVRN